MIVTRFAPSPTGYLHLGHAFAALTAARAGARFLLRIEDLDKDRTREEFVAAIFEDLAWLGLVWEEPALRQSTRSSAYGKALAHLKPFIYPCFCTRKEIADEIARAAEAPHIDVLRTGDILAASRPDGPLYPGTCRRLSSAERATRIAGGELHAIRLDAAKAAAAAGPLTFIEGGQVHRVDPILFGDVVLARKDLPAAYHLAVVVDDAHQGVSLITRGEDLLPATHVQRLLQVLLGYPAPAYAHHRLILDKDGRKFSKRDQAVTLRTLRAQGVTPAELEALF
ncbi:MAG TPA: tRNA glutamyl-Q(34) synthetase GluQRS [Rhizomicrobium sp.]|nr:tRNA glutamyl-Q(34) synthetase GluQRS [Rhizomicrobium sp.]